MNKERLWTKDFIVVSTTNFLIYLVFFLLMVIMASYAVDKSVSYTHLRAHETVLDLVCRLLLEKQKKKAGV